MKYIVTNRHTQEEVFEGDQDECCEFIMTQEDPNEFNYAPAYSNEYYSPSGTMEYYDHKTEQWYNRSGQRLRDPEEYNPRQEGYTPFGDEGDDY